MVEQCSRDIGSGRKRPGGCAKALRSEACFDFHPQGIPPQGHRLKVLEPGLDVITVELGSPSGLLQFLAEGLKSLQPAPTHHVHYMNSFSGNCGKGTLQLQPSSCAKSKPTKE